MFNCYFFCPNSGFVTKYSILGSEKRGGGIVNQEPCYEYLLKTAHSYSGCGLCLDPEMLTQGDDRKHWLWIQGLRQPKQCFKLALVSKDHRSTQTTWGHAG